MNTSTIPEKTAPATTLFEFTEDDLKDALSRYVNSRGGCVPVGDINLIFEDYCGHGGRRHPIRMRVTHDQPAPEPEKGKSIRATCYESICNAVSARLPVPQKLPERDAIWDTIFLAIDAALDSTRADTVREYSELLRKNCPHLCTDCHEAAKTASSIQAEMGVAG